MDIREYLKKQRLILDGAMGTYYSNVTGNDHGVAEYANLHAPQTIEEIHLAYMLAGAKLIRTNTFAANLSVLKIDAKEQGLIIHNACQIANSARNQAIEILGTKDIYIAGSIGPIPQATAFYEDEQLEEYKRMIDLMLEEELDVILFETFSDLRYLKELASYIRSRSDILIMVNFCLNKNGYTLSGISAKRLLEEIATIEEIEACGFNCGVGSGHLYQMLKRLEFPENKYIVAAPNAGYPQQYRNRMIFMDNAKYFSENMKRIADLGIDVIGGCCGTTPKYIEQLAFEMAKVPRKVVVTSSPKEQEPIVNQANNELMKLFEQGQKVVAVELDPPYDSDIDKIIECAHRLKSHKVDVVTLADSPMGRSRIDSILMSLKIAENTGIRMMPHVCCRDKNMISMRSTLLGAYINGIRNLLVVTGDPVPSVSRLSTTSVFDYNSIHLMNYIKEMNEEHFKDEPMVYGGALNYSRGLLEKVVERMNKKIDAGASYFLTQPIFCEEDIERIAQIKDKVPTKILCGIMPLISYRNANFIKNEITGIHVPDSVLEQYHENMSKEEGELVGAEIANDIIKKLGDIADGYYFMLPFNRVSLMDKIIVK